ncbi:transposase [Dokdonella fugitiva]|nr:transposase [Dokdonella fugitiva]
MARLPRPDLAGIPQHVVQRGNNRMPCFFDDDDRRRYGGMLREAASRYGCRIHAYVLMSNHVHLLVSPETAAGVARMMQELGRAYVSTFNARHRRSGTLWEGRYKSCLVDSETYLLRCYRYIELNPVRAAMVAAPSEHPWSSYHANAAGRDDPLVHPHAVYLALGPNVTERCVAYRALFNEAIGDEQLAEIRAYVQQQRALGNDRFQRLIETELGRCARVRPAHRPRRDAESMPE